MNSSKPKEVLLEELAASVEPEAFRALKVSMTSSDKLEEVSSKEEGTRSVIYSKSLRSSLVGLKVNREARQDGLNNKQRAKT